MPFFSFAYAVHLARKRKGMRAEILVQALLWVRPVSTTGSLVAGIASTRIASGGGVFHKPQANNAGGANGTDASSPFDQLLGSATAGQAAVGSAATGQPGDDQSSRDKADAGKKSGKNAKLDGKANNTQQAANQDVSNGTTLIQANAANSVASNIAANVAANAANDDNTGSDNSSAATGSQSTDPSIGQPTDPSAQQTAPDPSQSLAPTQNSASMQASSDPGNEIDNAIAALADAGAQTSNTSSATTAPPDGSGGADTPAASASAANSSAASTTGPAGTSKAGKASVTDQAGADIQAQTKDASSQTDTATQSGAPKKDHKSGKARDQDNTGTSATGVQSAPPDPTAVAAVAAMISPAPAATNNAAPSTGDVMPAAAIGPAKDAAKNTQANVNPTAGAKPPALADQASGNASNADPASGTQPSPTGATADSQSVATPSAAATQGADS
ncbi:MAG TPA: hypothetical protein VMU31_04035, partial [Rhizomicrobium sp.]|nr:hypothetical protein [Rhizomicrobium sp.]